jgi:hypothetical protein
MNSKKRPSRSQSADIEFVASVEAEELRFDEQPDTEVRFFGEPGHESASGSDRTRLPEKVEPGVTYRDIRDYRLASLRELGPRRAGTRHLSIHPPIASAKPTKSPMAASLPAGSHKCCDTRPPAAIRKRPSGRSRFPRIDRSTITTDTTGTGHADLERRFRPRTQGGGQLGKGCLSITEPRRKGPHKRLRKTA